MRLRTISTSTKTLRWYVNTVVETSQDCSSFSASGDAGIEMLEKSVAVLTVKVAGYVKRPSSSHGAPRGAKGQKKRLSMRDWSVATVAAE